MTTAPDRCAWTSAYTPAAGVAGVGQMNSLIALDGGGENETEKGDDVSGRDRAATDVEKNSVLVHRGTCMARMTVVPIGRAEIPTCFT